MKINNNTYTTQLGFGELVQSRQDLENLRSPAISQTGRDLSLAAGPQQCQTSSVSSQKMDLIHLTCFFSYFIRLRSRFFKQWISYKSFPSQAPKKGVKSPASPKEEC